MPWYFPWSESIKKRACRYLLQHYLGDFLKEKLDLDQLSVDLYNGKGTIKEVPLDVWALNEMLSNSGVPIELVDGFIESISVLVPWKALLNDSCEIEIHGLQLTFAGRQKSEGSLVESIHSWSSMSMTTSIQMAQECLKQDPTLADPQESGQSFEGLEAFAQTIESVLARVRLSFVNTKIRLEHLPFAAKSGVGIDLTIDRIDYWDLSHEEIGRDNTPQHSVYEPVAVAIKNFQIIGANLFIDEFPKQNRTRLRSMYSDEDEDLSGSPLSPLKEDYTRYVGGGVGSSRSHQDEDIPPNLLPKVKFLSSCGKQNIKLKLKQNDAIPGHKIDLEYSIAALNMFLTPREFHLLNDVVTSLSEAASSFSDTSSTSRDNNIYYNGQNHHGNQHQQQQHQHHHRPKMREMRTEDFTKVEESLQQQFTSVDSHDWKSAINSLNSTEGTSMNRASSEEEFFSMTDYPLPQLGQPTLLNTVKQCNLTGSEDISTGRFSPTSPRSTLSNISLGGSSGSLTSKGTLTEKASTIFRGSTSGSPGQRTQHGFVSSPTATATTNLGLAGVGKLDDTGESTRVRMRASNIIIIVLHRDPLEGVDSVDCSLEEISANFFNHVSQYSIQSLFGINADDVKDNLLSICTYDHLRILSSALNIEAEFNSNSQSIDLILGKLSIDENLFEDNGYRRKPYSQTQVVSFDQQDVSPLYPGSFGASLSPCVKLKISKTARSATGVHSRGSMAPKSQITVELGTIILDVDLTLMDRIAALLSQEPLYKTSSPAHPHYSDMYNSLATGKSANHETAYRQAMYDSPMNSDYKTDLVCKCAKSQIFLRIPVPDLRSSSNLEKKPWWRRQVHKESLLIDLHGFELKTILASSNHPTSSSYDLGFREAKGTFITPTNKYHVFDIGPTTEEGESGSMGVDMPRILINLTPPSSRSVFETSEGLSKDDSSPDSIEDQYPWMKSEPSPFSTQPNMYNENEEMVTPGSVNEMNAFQEFVSSNTSMAVNCYFPSMRMNLHTNEVFELFYNRIFGDLVMFEPTAPAPVELPSKMNNPYESVHINLASHIGQLDSGMANLNAGDKFFMCRSAVRGDTYDSHSTGDDTSLFSGDFYNDAYTRQHQQTNFSFSLHIDDGKIALFPPLNPATETENKEDTLHEDSDESLLGHVVISAKEAHLFVASGFKGKTNLDFIELYTNTIDFYHNSILNESIDFMLMQDALCIDYLEQTIYPSMPSIQKKCRASCRPEGTAMLSLAMKCVSHPESKRKENTVSVAIRGGTLKHRVLPSGHSWLTQIMDFMDIKDFAITGYTFPSVVTTLHMHLWGCAIDYRPLHIPIHSLLTMESFSLSSNIIPGSSTSILRFIFEDSALHLCDRSLNDMCDFDEFVSVLDMGIFELSLKFNSDKGKKQPVFEMTMSNNLLNIRTCADSCVALMKLVQYFASDGDLQTGIAAEIERDFNESLELASQELSQPAPSQLPTTSEVVEGERENDSIDIHSLMIDAMNDTDEMVDDRFQGTVIDEHIDEETGDESDTSADEFCLLDDAQAEVQDEFEPVLRQISDIRINLIENFIPIPQGKHDQLLSPDGYPCATHRYTIKEMSLMWQMYGGSDFTLPKSRRPSSASQQTSAPQYNNPMSKGKSDKANRANRVAGGPNRDLETLMELQMNKIRFQHEVFPETAKQIYRDVLLVYDLELRDRLTSSMINKFLYRFSSENMPKQSSANMISIRLLVTKPEDSARSEEAALRISLQPLRFNVDQDSLFFLREFFTKVGGMSSSTNAPNRPPSAGNRPPSVSSVDYSSSPGGVNYLSGSPATGTEPFSGVHSSSPSTASPQMSHLQQQQQRASVGDTPTIRHTPSTESLKSTEQPSLFIKSFLFSPEVPIRLDYHGKYVNIEKGTLAGLIMGLSQLNCSELKLKRLCSRSGLLGADKLVNFIINEWLNDIKQNQLQSILGGVGPAYSLMQLFQGLKDLFWMPVLQYRQDGRIVRGIQKGAHSFSTSTAMAVLELSNKLVSTMQGLAELTFDMVSSGPSHVSSRQSTTQAAHPAELREGIANAYTVLTEGLSETASNLVRVATEEHEKKGMTGAVGGVLRQIPPTVVKPLILATEATSNVLGGAMNQLQPDKREEALQKWKQNSKTEKK